MISFLMDEFTTIAQEHQGVYKLDYFKINRREQSCNSFVHIHCMGEENAFLNQKKRILHYENNHFRKTGL